MLEASRGHLALGAWDLYVGDDEPRTLAMLERLAIQPVPSFCRVDGFFVAEVDGEPAAALCGYDPGAPGMTNPDAAIAAAVASALGWGDAERAAADARLEGFATCLSAPPPDVWVVEWVATRPAFRRRGLVRALLAAALDAGRGRGFRASQITLFIGNTPAERAYERAGYAIAGDKRHPAFQRSIGCPGLRRMTRALGA